MLTRVACPMFQKELFYPYRFSSAYLKLLALTLGGYIFLGMGAAGVHHFITGLPLRDSWRWIHDTTMIPSNIYLSPIIGILLLTQMILERFSVDLLRFMPKTVHGIVFLVLSIFLSFSVSQLSGGCLWFYVSEGWWVRFGHGWNWIGGGVVPEQMVVAVYFVLTIICLIMNIWHFNRYLNHTSPTVKN